MTEIRSTGGASPFVEHPYLVSLAGDGVAALRGLAEEVEASPGGSIWIHHNELIDSASDLAEHLDAALDALERRRYAPAFAAIRTCIEHHVLDRLLLLADRYRQRIVRVSDEEFERWTAERGAGAQWATNVEALERVGQGAAVVRRGHDVRDADGTIVEQLSPYWPVVGRHQPTLGPPSVQEQFFNGIGDLKDHETWARENRDLYRDFLRWESMVENLVLNGLIRDGERIRLDVHYRFLSTFAHPTKYGYDLLKRNRGATSSFRPGEHVLSELALLYVVAISRLELEAFVAFVNRRPNLLGLSDPTTMSMTIERLKSGSAHLWFLGDEPAAYDFFAEANKRAWKGWEKGTPIAGDRQRPASVPADEVGYYSDPLDRLNQLHFGGNEMTTGFSHGAMW